MKHIPVLFLFMLFCHIVDDYYLQGLLGKLKQKSFWEKEAPDEKYKNDYIVALLMHSASWAFMIMLPLLVYENFAPTAVFYIIWCFNVSIHAAVDHWKCNKLEINLIQDQSIHLLQIIVTLLIIVL